MSASILAGESVATGMRLQCPRCEAAVGSLDCASCGFRMRVRDGIIHALTTDDAEHFACFIQDYEAVRAAEGRGSDNDGFYLGLPYVDLSRRNRSQWHIRSRSYDCLLKHVLKSNPQVNGGWLLDLGAGNCWMSYRLALAGYRPVAVDLLTNRNDGLGAAEHYRNHLSELFPRVQANLASLPFQSSQFDAALFNASLHYAENVEDALSEALRCVRYGGIVIICDTPWYSRDESGRRMVSERHAAFMHRYGMASDSLESMEYLTDERLRALEDRFAIKWTPYYPSYGFRWAMRPLVARLHNRREPSRFRIYVARKES